MENFILCVVYPLDLLSGTLRKVELDKRYSRYQILLKNLKCE